MPRFEWPWVLLLLLAVPLALLSRPHSAPSLGFNRLHAALPQSRRERWLRLPVWLRTAALALLVLALAGPRIIGRPVQEISKTIALQLVVDCSGSMSANDMQYRNRMMSRIAVVREVSQGFLFGQGGLPGRTQDMIGLVAFAEEPVTLCPLTLAHETLRPVVASLRIGDNADGTAIGDAVAVAGARIRQTEASTGAVFKSKAIILITDGGNNAGSRTPDEAAKLARQWGIRIYAIAIRPGFAKRELREPEANTLESMARISGGIARDAVDGESLREIYREIDTLERSDRSSTRPSGGWEWLYALGLSGLFLLAAEVALTQTWLRRIP